MLEVGKKLAGERAVDYVEAGMVVGLGTGSTVYWTIMKLGERVKQGLRISGVPTSKRTEKLAIELGIPLLGLAEVEHIDITIDGADEINTSLDMIKGGGGALLREKMVASASRRVIAVVDDAKTVPILGKFPLPVEVVPFGYELTMRQLRSLECRPVLRMDQQHPYVTDNGNYIVDCYFDQIGEPELLGVRINQIPGAVENGLFVHMADTVVIGRGSGEVTIISRD